MVCPVCLIVPVSLGLTFFNLVVGLLLTIFICSLYLILLSNKKCNTCN